MGRWAHPVKVRVQTAETWEAEGLWEPPQGGILIYAGAGTVWPWVDFPKRVTG